MSITTVRLQPEVEELLEQMVRKRDRSKNWLINQAVAEYASRLEQEEQRWLETLKAMESVANGRVVAGDDVHQWLGSWGGADEKSPPGAGE
ncbi:MAG TPA: ribbon-helix-helix protein, CopG family [Opitutales bacterium]|nr:ribbon-helix-helix protein, CopG family [Opitutales bacterium]